MLKKSGFKMLILSFVLFVPLTLGTISNVYATFNEPPFCEFGEAELSSPMSACGITVTRNNSDPFIPQLNFITQCVCRGGLTDGDTLVIPWPVDVDSNDIPFEDLTASEFENLDIPGTRKFPDLCQPEGAVGLNLTSVMGLRNDGETITMRGMIMFWVCP